MDDLTRIAVNDMKHELCDEAPCLECRNEYKVHVELKCLECTFEFKADAYSGDALTVATEILKNHKHNQLPEIVVSESEGK